MVRPEGKVALGKNRCNQEDNINLDLKGKIRLMRLRDVNWVHLA
jgi:hypothetical protein